LKKTVEEYLVELSRRSIVPGGGSASALVAAIGAGLNLMVINYSVKGEGSDAVSQGLVAARERQKECLERLSGLVDEDCRVFRELMEAVKAGADTQEKYSAAANVPMRICRECHISMDISAHLLDTGNTNLVTDVGGAVYLLRAAFYSARLNAEVNMMKIKDWDFVERAIKTLNDMRVDVENIDREVRIRLSKMDLGE